MSNAFLNPYIPHKRVNKAIISKNLSDEIKKSLEGYGIELILIEANPFLPLSLTCHADMQLVNISEGVLVYAPGVSCNTCTSLKEIGYKLIKGLTPVEKHYPFDIAYNCAIVGNKAFLNPKFTDPLTLDLIEKAGIEIYPVKQGYAKCSTCIVSEEAIITADFHIHKKAVEAGIDVLLINPQTNIVLPGYNYGFLGGACGLLSANELGFFGDINKLFNADSIIEFCKKHGKSILSLSKSEIFDLGGLFPLSTV